MFDRCLGNKNPKRTVRTLQNIAGWLFNYPAFFFSDILDVIFDKPSFKGTFINRRKFDNLTRFQHEGEIFNCGNIL